MAHILQMTFSNVFSSNEIAVVPFKFHFKSLLFIVQFTIKTTLVTTESGTSDKPLPELMMTYFLGNLGCIKVPPGFNVLTHCPLMTQ